jgi:molybdopterin adenylyltransferase
MPHLHSDSASSRRSVRPKGPDHQKHSTKRKYAAAVVTVSDSAAAGSRKDLSGPAVAKALQKAGFDVREREIVADQQSRISSVLRRMAGKVDLVVTAGGTGIAARDVTPEATRAVCGRLVEGMAERMRSQGAKKTLFAALSRGVCGVAGRSLIVNLPGSPAAAVESLMAIIGVLPHALELLRGNTRHVAF